MVAVEGVAEEAVEEVPGEGNHAESTVIVFYQVRFFNIYLSVLVWGCSLDSLLDLKLKWKARSQRIFYPQF